MSGDRVRAHTYPTAWAAVADHAAACDVDTIFGLPGDDLSLLAALEDSSTRVVLCRDQRNAAFMATGYAMASGRPGVCVLGKGPAITNALTGVLEARSARVPLIVYASGTGAGQLGTGAHQELDQLAVVRTLAKWAVRVEDPQRVCPTLDKAAVMATHGVPGPVYVELPEPVAAAAAVRDLPWRTLPAPRPAPSVAASARTYRMLCAASRPLILVGGGARHRNQDGGVERLAEVIGAGIAVTASGRGSVNEHSPAFCGLSGLYAPPGAARLWEQTDLVVALGSRLEETATFKWSRPPAPVLQVTLAEEDVATDFPGEVLLGDVAHTVAGWLELARADPPAADPEWRKQIRMVRDEITRTARERVAATHHREGVPVASVLSTLDRVLPPERCLVQENGLQDMWSYFYPYWSCGDVGGSVVASEQTSLGFAAAAAVGVACADPGRPVVALVGDGAFRMFAPDLVTLAALDVAVLYVVLDNGGYGWLQANLNRVSAQSRFRFTNDSRPDQPTRDTGLPEISVAQPEECEPAIQKAWAICAAGRSAVVTIEVDLADVAPGLETIVGAFPDVPDRQG